MLRKVVIKMDNVPDQYEIAIHCPEGINSLRQYKWGHQNVTESSESIRVIIRWPKNLTRTSWPRKVRDLILDSDSMSQGVKG